MGKLAVIEIPKKEKKPKAKRRGKRGRGSVWLPKYKLADGAVRSSRFYWIRYTDENGVRHNEPTNFDSKDGAEQALTDRLGKIDRGEFDLPNYREVTLQNLTDALRRDYVNKGRRSTDKLERSLVRLEEFFKPTRRVLSITEEDISAYSAHRLAQKNTQFPTVNRELAALKAAFRLGLKNDMVRRVPNISIKDEGGREKDGEFTAEQFTKLTGELPECLLPVAEFVSRTGMRIMEPLALRWHEVNVERGELRLSGRRTKTGQQKVLYLKGKALDVLKAQRKLHDDKFPDQPFVFPDEDGQAIPYDRALDQFQAACKRAGISFANNDGTRLPGWHDLRRTFARMARRNGVPDKVIMEIAGWKTHAMLLRYLGEAQESDQRAAFERMDEALS